MAGTPENHVPLVARRRDGSDHLTGEIRSSNRSDDCSGARRARRPPDDRKAAIHTLPSKQGGWTNEREGSGRAIGNYPTKAAAQAAGRDLARQEQTEHIIHTKDGRISARNSYGNDPRSRKG